MPLAVLSPVTTHLAVPGRPAGSARHASPSSLAGRLNQEWAQLVATPSSSATVAHWATSCPELAGVGSLEEVLAVIATNPGTQDRVLLTLLERAQAGEQLAGRTVLPAMLGRAVRVSATVARRLDVRGDQEEALACAVAALWQVIATYPVRSRRARVAANLAMDTVAVAQRGHTGSSHLRRRALEVPVADLATLRVAAHRDREPDELHGPADAELITLLAWAVRTRVLDAAEAQLLLRVYTPDTTGRRTNARAVAEQLGLS